MVNHEPIFAVAVEDDQGSALLIQAILRRIGIDVTVHSTGEKFLDYLRALPTPPNLVLLDINLPRHNGIDIVKAMRADPQFADTVVIAISAIDPIEFIPKGKAAGFNSFIRKPVSIQKLPKQIERILAGEAIWEH